MRSHKLAAILMVTVIMSMAFVPVLDSSSDNQEYAAAYEPHGPYEDINYTTNMAVGAAIPLEYVLAFGVGVGAGVTFAILQHFFANDGNKAGGLDAELKAYLREQDADKIITNYDTATGIYAKLVESEAQIWAFTRAYWDMQAETAASSLWSPGAVFNGDRILNGSGFIENTVTYKHNATSTINEFSLHWADIRTEWNKGDLSNTYGPMRAGFSWGSNEWFDTAGDLSIALMDHVIATATANRVYINVVPDEFALPNSNLFYSDAAAQITNAATGKTFQLAGGANDLVALNVTSGWYTLSPGSYSGNMIGSSSVTGASPQAALILSSGSSYATVRSSGSSYIVDYNNTSYVTSDVNFVVTWPDKSSVTQKRSVDLGRVLTSYDAVCTAINAATSSAVSAAQTAWYVYEMLETSSILIRPSSVTAGMQTNTTLSPMQSAALYSLVLQQLRYFSENVTPEDIKVSIASLDLYVFGDIYYQGTLIADNAIYTPLAYLADKTISTGYNNWSAPGLAIIWATGINDITEFTSEGMQYGLLEFGEGYTLDIFDIVSHNEIVNSVTLEVESMEYLGLIGFQDRAGLQTFDLVDLTPLVMIIMCLIGAILALFGFFLKMPILIILGGVVIAIGILGAGFIVGLFL